MWYVRGRVEVYTGFLRGNLKEIDPGVDGRMILKYIFAKWDGDEWTGLSWLRTGTGGGHL
jgi:hypothetical protein